MRPLRAAIAVACVLLPACARVPSGAKRASQPALVVQRIGAAKLTLRYNRPSARGRKLFGGIVPWDSVWCPGADEGTRLASTVDLSVGGRTLPRGAYTLWMIPDSARDWTLIFSNASRAYHTPYPGAAKDALRIPVRPQPSPYVETLSWDFPVAAKDSAVLTLRWGGVAVAVPLRPR